MGTSESKLATKVPGETVEEKGSIPSTPILATKNIDFDYGINEDERDPRSPSRNIARTPIQLLTEAAAKLQQFQTNHCETTDTKTPEKTTILLGVDPRSPTTDFERTPIIITVNPDSKIPQKIHNKLLDNARKFVILGTPKTTSKKGIPPRLLESSPIVVKSIDSNKRKSLVGLLETNIDYTETNLDVVIKEKGLNLSRSLPTDDIHGFIGIINEDPRSPTLEFERTPIQVIKPKNIHDTVFKDKSEVTMMEDENGVEAFLNVEDPNSELKVELKVEIKECEIQGELASVNDLVGEAVIPELSEPNIVEIEEFPEPAIHKIRSSRSAPITPSRNNVIDILSPKQANSQPVSPPVIDLTADVQELDKKLSNLIYEDNTDLVVCPRMVKLKEQSRTPLGDKNCIAQNTVTHHQKLKVSDKPRKLEYAVSKIPLYKDKTKNKHSRKVQCENTPPRNMVVKSRNSKSQWDNDHTLVI